MMSLCFFAVLALVPGPFYLQENVYRQLPLYCFLEKKAESVPWQEDPETYEKIIASNGAYLGEQVQRENGLIAAEEESDDGNGLREDNQSKTSGSGPGIEQPSAETGDEPSSEVIGEELGEVHGEEQNEEISAAEEERQDEEDKLDEMQKAQEENEGSQMQMKENDMSENRENDGNKEEDRNDAVDGVSDESAMSGEGEDSSREKEEQDVDVIDGEEEITTAARLEGVIEPHPVLDLSPETLADYDYLLGQFFILDPNTATNAEQLNAAQFLSEDLTMEKDAEKPQILIYHSHSQETFADSREGEPEDTIVGVGNYLTQLLTENYGYHVIHVTETFDIINGEIDRSRAYDYSREYVEQVLEENPSIEVIIDLHRDGVPEDRRLVTEINGKDTAQIMFYNGLSYTVNNGPVDYLPNPYIQDNLAFSFQLEYQAALYYPELYRGIYLAGLRYNLHLRPKALLLEAGAQTNTVQEVKNAMEPFADLLDRVLQG